jgi:hypothetical protein
MATPTTYITLGSGAKAIQLSFAPSPDRNAKKEQKPPLSSIRSTLLNNTSPPNRSPTFLRHPPIFS